mmetsp:Transcript_1208/g.3126  ORF Transcript_1208/g.3126 Transcript_1208/m.3126 type:complete len:178 (+) Transcript_1208:296-829(+)
MHSDGICDRMADERITVMAFVPPLLSQHVTMQGKFENSSCADTLFTTSRRNNANANPESSSSLTFVLRKSLVMATKRDQELEYRHGPTWALFSDDFQCGRRWALDARHVVHNSRSRTDSDETSVADAAERVHRRVITRTRQSHDFSIRCNARSLNTLKATGGLTPKGPRAIEEERTG